MRDVTRCYFSWRNWNCG